MTTEKFKGDTLKTEVNMRRFRTNLQFFAEGTGDGGNAQAGTEPNGTQAGAQSQGTSTAEIDYTKIQQMLDGTLKAKEETALKAYFKQQGLSQEEAEQAMAAFRAEKAKNVPDVGAIQSQLVQAQEEAKKAKIEASATTVAASLGVGTKTIPYIIKMADFSTAIGDDGKINTEAVTTAINKVLEDIPELKPKIGDNQGFVQVGASGNNNAGGGNPAQEQLNAIFGIRPKK